MNKIQLSKTITDNDLDNEASGRRRNRRWPKFYALFLEQDLMKPNQDGLDNVHQLRLSARLSAAILDEAARVGCDCFWSSRMRRWVLWRRQPWQLEPSLRQAGVLLESIGNRDANYAEILAALGEDCPS
jgi:hypothetical protein